MAKRCERRAVARNRAARLALAVALCAGCAPLQVVPLDVGPGAVEVFVDGARAEGAPSELELRADRDHKIYLKRAGYVPELVVLESRRVEGRDRLEPAIVRARLAPRRGEREVEVRDEGGDPASR